MTQLSPQFSPQEFELRNYINPYLTEEQAAQVNLTETRVRTQVSFLAQMLGWSGDNYWSNLPATVSQARQLLGGSYGVYNGFIVPRILEVRTWEEISDFNAPRVAIVVVPADERIREGHKAYLDFDEYPIRSISVSGDTYELNFGEVSDAFFSSLGDNVQLKIDAPEAKPQPFYRPQVGVSGDASFTCSASGDRLTLYPLYDREHRFPYKFPILFAGSVCYFDKPIYMTYGDSTPVQIDPTYDDAQELWFLSLPESLPPTVRLRWDYSNPSSLVYSYAQVSVLNWHDPSDWGSVDALRNFTGAWGNKGGVLPFNFAFDSLGIHGFSERNSVYFGSFTKDLWFNQLVNFVCCQQISTSFLRSGDPSNGDLWWNSDTGDLAVWYDPHNDAEGCWVEVEYRVQPGALTYPEISFPNVASFLAGSASFPPGTEARIANVTGLTAANGVLGIQGTLTQPGTLILYKQADGLYWNPVRFVYLAAPEFEADALLLPRGVPVTIQNGAGLEPLTPTYIVSDLYITITDRSPVVLTKWYNNVTWEISPDSLLKFIANTSLFGGLLNGEMWWDYANLNPEFRSAAVFSEEANAWVSVNTFTPQGAPPATLNYNALLVYCDGQLLSSGETRLTDDYSFSYTIDTVNGNFQFAYNPRNFNGSARWPAIELSDSISSAYRYNITEYVFSGQTYYMSPNVCDAEVPLRLWKGEELQVADTLEHLEEGNYINPLKADFNNGPGPDNWQRFFVRLPLDYQRNGFNWQKTALICQNFAYYGSSIEPDQMKCPPEENLPAVYEDLLLYNTPVPDYTYVYSEPYLYSNLAYFDLRNVGDYGNAGVFPALDLPYDEFYEAQLVDYEPLHSRQANVTSPVGAGYGDWVGQYFNVDPSVDFTGYIVNDTSSEALTPVQAPVWDASVYKYAPTCQFQPESFNVDANNYKVGYAYFVADASAAEDGFFDPQQESAWRNPETLGRSLYLISGEPEQIIATLKTTTLPTPVVPPTEGGSVVTWGPWYYGGDSSSVASSLSSDVTTVFPNSFAFAALKSNGSVVTWGDSSNGGDSSSVVSSLSSGVTDIFSNVFAFAALKSNGSVVTWGNSNLGGNSSSVASSLSSDVTNIFSNTVAFAALKSNGSVVTWGDGYLGGDSSSVASSLSSGVVNIFSNAYAFAALKSDGSVVTWGEPSDGGNSSSVASSLSSGVVNIFSNPWAFAALKSDGSVVTWGYSGDGGDSSSVASSLSSGVTSIFSTETAFAALKSDGSVITWGNSTNGGNSSAVAANLNSVTQIFANNVAFAALKSNGSVVTWGSSYNGGDSSSVASSLSSGVTDIFPSFFAFAALKSNGSVVTWGDPESGGDSSSVTSSLSSGVTDIFPAFFAFAALKAT